MARRGCYTALLLEEQKFLATSGSTSELFERLNSLYKVASADGRIQYVDKSWDAMHRVLCEGWLDYLHGEEAKRACVIGGTQLSDRPDWLLSYVQPHLVKKMSEAISTIEEQWFREQYFLLDELPVGLASHYGTRGPHTRMVTNTLGLISKRCAISTDEQRRGTWPHYFSPIFDELSTSDVGRGLPRLSFPGVINHALLEEKAMTKSEFDRLVTHAMAKAARLGGPSKLRPPLKEVVIVVSAQGVIDNGGLRYFFESDFPGRPPYSLFVEAFQAIGAIEEAAALEAAVNLFPFSNPHKHKGRRNKFLDRFQDKRMDPFEAFTKQLCGEKRIWTLLQAFAARHAPS